MQVEVKRNAARTPITESAVAARQASSGVPWLHFRVEGDPEYGRPTPGDASARQGVSAFLAALGVKGEIDDKSQSGQVLSLLASSISIS